MALEELEELDNNHNISNAEAKAALAVSNALAYVTAAENVLVKGEIAMKNLIVIIMISQNEQWLTDRFFRINSENRYLKH